MMILHLKFEPGCLIVVLPPQFWTWQGEGGVRGGGNPTVPVGCGLSPVPQSAVLLHVQETHSDDEPVGFLESCFCEKQ